MLEVGQVISITLKTGFHSTVDFLTTAKITKIDPLTGLIYADVSLSNGGIRKMFGYESDIRRIMVGGGS